MVLQRGQPLLLPQQQPALQLPDPQHPGRWAPSAAFGVQQLLLAPAERQQTPSVRPHPGLLPGNPGQHHHSKVPPGLLQAPVRLLTGLLLAPQSPWHTLGTWQAYLHLAGHHQEVSMTTMPAGQHLRDHLQAQHVSMLTDWQDIMQQSLWRGICSVLFLPF